MANQTLQSSTLIEGGYTKAHPQDLIIRAEYLTDLLQWFEYARSTLDRLEEARRHHPELDKLLKEMRVPHPMDWSESETWAVVELHMIQADALKTARSLIDAGRGWPRHGAPAR